MQSIKIVTHSSHCFGWLLGKSLQLIDGYGFIFQIGFVYFQPLNYFFFTHKWICKLIANGLCTYLFNYKCRIISPEIIIWSLTKVNWKFIFIWVWLIPYEAEMTASELVYLYPYAARSKSMRIKDSAVVSFISIITLEACASLWLWIWNFFVFEIISNKKFKPFNIFLIY